jgi:hypothetical protein
MAVERLRGPLHMAIFMGEFSCLYRVGIAAVEVVDAAQSLINLNEKSVKF